MISLAYIIEIGLGQMLTKNTNTSQALTKEHK